MTSISRRNILERGALGVAAVACAAMPAKGSMDRRVTVGLIGAGGMGSNHLRLLAARRDVEVAHVCDVDGDRLAEAGKVVEKGSGKAPQTVKDLRRVLDDRRVDAVWIATPDHWHAPAAILALDAGKHVYVEKPCSHNIREGRLMVEAARRNRKVCQVGTQSRSTEMDMTAIQMIHEGVIGEVLSVRVWNSQLRRNIGKLKPTPPPAGLDYDTWIGPAPFLPHQANRLHGAWRWWFNFGAGDMGNDGVHDLDVAAWGL